MAGSAWSEVDVTWVSVTSWLEVGRRSLAEVGPGGAGVLVTVTSWAEGDGSHCHLLVQGGRGSLSPHSLWWVTVLWLR